ncbi:hypothetical protein ACI2LF_23285 [Kribbella sp. NPDC020789]
MPSLRARAIRWIDTDQCPYILEAEFTDADGVRRLLVDKDVVFGGPELSLATIFPIEILAGCELLTRAGDRVRITVDRPYGIGTPDDNPEFEVYPDQLLD